MPAYKNIDMGLPLSMQYDAKVFLPMLRCPNAGLT